MHEHASMRADVLDASEDRDDGDERQHGSCTMTSGSMVIHMDVATMQRNERRRPTGERLQVIRSAGHWPVF